jgi:hypothetical protein
MKRQFLERSRFQLSAAIGEGEDNDNRWDKVSETFEQCSRFHEQKVLLSKVKNGNEVLQ